MGPELRFELERKIRVQPVSLPLRLPLPGQPLGFGQLSGVHALHFKIFKSGSGELLGSAF